MRKVSTPKSKLASVTAKSELFFFFFLPWQLFQGPLSHPPTNTLGQFIFWDMKARIKGKKMFSVVSR